MPINTCKTLCAINAIGKGKRQSIRQREKQMEDTIERYQKEMEELQKSRKEIIRKAKEEAEHLLQESNARIENTIRNH